MCGLLYGPTLTPIHDFGKTIAIQTFVGKVMSLLFNTLSRFVMAFPPRSKHILISWQQSPSAVILEPKKRKPVTASTYSPSISHEMMGFGFPGGSEVKKQPAIAGDTTRDTGLIPSSGRSPGGSPTNSIGRFHFAYILSNICRSFGRLFVDSCSHRCEVIPHCGFYLHFSW